MFKFTKKTLNLKLFKVLLKIFFFIFFEILFQKFLINNIQFNNSSVYVYYLKNSHKIINYLCFVDNMYYKMQIIFKMEIKTEQYFLKKCLYFIDSNQIMFYPVYTAHIVYVCVLNCMLYYTNKFNKKYKIFVYFLKLLLFIHYFIIYV